MAAAQAERLCAARNRKVTALPTLTPDNVASVIERVENFNGILLASLASIVRRYPSVGGLALFATGLGKASREAAAISRYLLLHRVSAAAALIPKERELTLQLDSEAAALEIPACDEAASIIGGSGRA